MDKPFFRLVGAPCGQHGQYTFYKALCVSGKRERIIAIGDFFFVRIWQDSELVSIGELQLLWTDRVSDQTLVSLRLYFLPENTPDGRNQHGEDEVLAINDKVVVKAEDLMSWMCEGEDWRWGLRAVWRGSCAPPTDAKPTQSLHHAKLDFSDVDKEKDSIEVDADTPGVVVFSYPRYCRYRALVSRLEGIQADWLRDSLVAALGGYSAPSNNTRILYCKETFEYPELEGHEFVCNHLAPRLKGRPRGRRRRAPRSRSRSRSSRSTDSDRGFQHSNNSDPDTPRRLSLRNGAPGKHSEEEDSPEKKHEETSEDKEFLVTLKQFYKEKGEYFKGHSLRDCSLRWLYWSVVSRGGYGAVCRRRLWSTITSNSPTHTRDIYERFLLPYENHERKKGAIFKYNGKLEEPQTIDTIDVTDSPLRDIENRTELPEKRLRTPSPKMETKTNIDNETGEFKEDVNIAKSAEVLNREFLESLPKEEEKPVKISVKPVQQLIDTTDHPLDNRETVSTNNVIDLEKPTQTNRNSSNFFNDLAYKFNLETRDALRSQQRAMCSVIPAHALTTAAAVSAASSINGYTAPRPPSHPPPSLPVTIEQPSTGTHRTASATSAVVNSVSRPLGRSSLRHVRVKPARPHHSIHNSSPAPPIRPDSASRSPPTPQGPVLTPPVPPVLLTVPQPHITGITNFGIHHPPQPSYNQHSDDEIVEVPYKPKSPEIIDLDEYDDECSRNDHTTAKKKKLELLKERGLEVTAIPCPGWPSHNAAVVPIHRQLLARAQLLQLYGYPPSPPPPRAAQAACPFGSAGATKTVYCDPRAPLMPAPHVILGAPPRAAVAPPALATSPPMALDLTRSSPGPPKVEITLVNKFRGANVIEPYAALYGRLAAYRQLTGQRDKR